MLSLYEHLILEQEQRKFFGKPVRWTTISSYPSKMNYQEFIDFTKNWGLQDNLQNKEMFVEDWISLFCAYHEVEALPENDEKELECKNKFIDQVVNTHIEYEKFLKRSK